MAQLGWSDVEIFDRAGLRTYTARSEKLLHLVNDNRVQLFPRGVAELEAEASVVRSLYPPDAAGSPSVDCLSLCGFLLCGSREHGAGSRASDRF